MFIQSCYINKNTEELRDKLEKLGYAPIYGQSYGSFLLCLKIGNMYDYILEADLRYNIKYELYSEKIIDCEKNEDLFLAIAALRDDSDYMQWFVTDADQELINQDMCRSHSPKGSFELCLTKNRYPKEWMGIEDFYSFIVPAHKATVEELIKHFQK